MAASTPTYVVDGRWVCVGCRVLGEGVGGCWEEGEDVVASLGFRPNGDDVDCRRETAVGGLEERFCGEAGA